MTHSVLHSTHERNWRVNPGEYLQSFFAELEKLQPGESEGLPHAITYEDGKLYALVSMGDARAKVRLQEVDPDPIKMAATVLVKWRSCLNGNLALE